MSLLPFTKDGLTYSVLNSDEEVVSRLLSKAFVNGEPLTKGRVEYSEFVSWVSPVVMAASQDGLSIVVRDSQGGYVAALICEDFYQAQVEDEGEPPCRALLDIFELLDALGADYKAKMNAEKKSGVALHAFMGFTVHNMQGKGIGRELRKACIKFAEEKGFTEVGIEATNPITAKLWTECGGNCIHQISPRNFKTEEGKTPWGNWDEDRKVSFVIVPTSKQ